MLTAKFDPQPFFRRTEHVALHVAADEVFGLLTRSLDLPGVWAALVKRDTGDYGVVPSGARVNGSDAEDVLFVRTTPVEVALTETGLRSRDHFECVAEVRAGVCVVPQRSELISFHKRILGSHRVAKDETIARYLQPAAREALARFAAENDAEALVDSSRAGAAGVVRQALEAACFAAGLALESAPVVRFTSEGVTQVQRTAAESARRRAEHEVARELHESVRQSQAEHLDHLSSLLARLQELSRTSPGIELPELIRTFSERERGQLYEALFASETPRARTQWIVVAAAEELLYFDPRQLTSPVRRLRVDGAAGPVRSVRSVRQADGTQVLLLGAARGVYRLPLLSEGPDLTWLVANAPPVRGGFNAAVLVDDRLIATHSELGLHEWVPGKPDRSNPLFAAQTRNARAVRDVEYFAGDLYCSIDDRVIRWPATERAEQPAAEYHASDTVTAVCPAAQGLFVGTSDGDVLFWADAAGEPRVLHRGAKRAVESLHVVHTHGVRRLLFTDTTPHVHARVLDDSFACRYEAGGQTLRRVEAAEDVLVAINELRDRLICWSPGKPDKPQAVIPIAAMTGHSVQDICLVGEA